MEVLRYFVQIGIALLVLLPAYLFVTTFLLPEKDGITTLKEKDSRDNKILLYTFLITIVGALILGNLFGWYD
jgi:uncharacterized membrane protein